MPARRFESAKLIIAILGARLFAKSTPIHGRGGYKRQAETRRQAAAHLNSNVRPNGMPVRDLPTSQVEGLPGVSGAVR